MTWRRALLGDWGRVVRDPLDLLRLTFLGAALVAAVLGEWGTALRMGLTFGVVLAVRRLQLPRPFDLAFLAGMSLQAWGNAFDLFTSFGEYDWVVHFVLPFATAPALYITLSRIGLVPDLAEQLKRRHLGGIWLVTFALGITVGTVYELYEWVAVHLVSADLHVGYDDTIGDLADDAAGSALGGLLLVLWGTRGWATTRRVPGGARAGGTAPDRPVTAPRDPGSAVGMDPTRTTETSR